MSRFKTLLTFLSALALAHPSGLCRYTDTLLQRLPPLFGFWLM
jgi:hypothetical protein